MFSTLFRSTTNFGEKALIDLLDCNFQKYLLSKKFETSSLMVYDVNGLEISVFTESVIKYSFYKMKK